MEHESPITDEMHEAYWRDGFVVARGLFDDAALEGWRNRLDAIVGGEIEPARGMLVMKDVMVSKGAVTPSSPRAAVAKIQDFENDDVLYSYVEHDRLLDCVERIIGHDVFTIHTMLINKPPGVDGRHPLHQDLLYFPFRPADKIVATWTALEPVTRENGCLVVLPGSHKGELLPHENPDWEWLNGAYWGAAGVGADSRRVHLEMEPGDTVLFHPILLHGSGRNRTPNFRRAISAHFGALACTWEWTHDDFFGRRYKVVRGEHAGQAWDGRRHTGPPVDPLEYIPLDEETVALVRETTRRGKE